VEAYDMNETAFDFLNLPYCRLKEVVGCIDGCHIRCTPPEKTQDMYYNRKCFHSVLLQACCDSRLLFTDFVAGLPGRASDSRLLKISTLYQDSGNLFSVQKRTKKYYILGDGGYPLLPWLMVPFENHGALTQEQEDFNKSLSSVRQHIERAFGLLKSRFRILKNLNVGEEWFADVIIVCCMLHNICILCDDGWNGLDDDHPEEEGLDPDRANDFVTSNIASIRRTEIMNNLVYEF
jgi:hypothetical protein